MQFRKKIRKGWLIIVMVLMIVLSFNFFSSELRNFFYSTFYPLQNVFLKTSDILANFFSYFSRVSTLQKENQQLKMKLTELLRENISLQSLKEENLSLREALKVGVEKDYELVAVHVIGRNLSSGEVLIIDKGAKDNLKKGMLVITPQKVLVGKIGKVFDSFSEVILLSDKESLFEVEIGKEKYPALLRGRGNLKVIASLIPIEAEIKNGDVISYRDFLVGKILSVNKNPQEPFQQAEVELLSQPYNLRTIFVIKN